MADSSTSSFESFFSAINFTSEYLRRFKDTGFDDMELLKSLNTDEKQQMFDLVGLSGKPGHLIKFKKALSCLQLPLTAPIAACSSVLEKVNDNSSINSATTTKQGQQGKFQRTISLVGGKFQVFGKATVVEKKQWEKFHIPNVKSDRLIYFNSITKAVYESAFVGKQSTFQVYLDGQRRFRHGVVTKYKQVQKVLSLYQEGMIPKANIRRKRYQDFPSDIKVEDVSKTQRVVEHFNGTIKYLNDIHDHLAARKKELYDDNMNERPWASNELEFIKETLLLVEEMMKQTEHMMHDVRHVMDQLQKRFDMGEVRKCEKRRKARREKENRSKVKKKKQIVQGKHARLSNSSDDELPIDPVE